MDKAAKRFKQPTWTNLYSHIINIRHALRWTNLVGPQDVDAALPWCTFFIWEIIPFYGRKIQVSEIL